MALTVRRSRRDLDIWPGFVDALANLLMVIIFLVMMFAMAHFFLAETLSGREQTLRRLQGQVDELAELLSLERKTGADLQQDVTRLSAQLQATLAERQDLAGTVSLLTQRAETAEKQAAALVQALDAAKTAAAADRDQQAQDLARLASDIAALSALRDELERQTASLSRSVEEKDSQLIEERRVSESTRAQLALLNQQMAALRAQILQLSSALDAAETTARERDVEIASLGQRLNAALASKVQELARYRSEFFGRLRDVLGDQAGIRIVGDRFVFQSEVLFASGSATLGDEGQRQILKVAETLKAVARQIPGDIEWILQVDGHTDKVPIATAPYASNWELSTARAMSVLRLLKEAGVPPARLSAAGFGEFHPLEDRDDPAAYQRNRRIELKLTQR
jgi:chemotaxis protein MotB